MSTYYDTCVVKKKIVLNIVTLFSPYDRNPCGISDRLKGVDYLPIKQPLGLVIVLIRYLFSLGTTYGDVFGEEVFI